jgi:hypothetical protein
MESMASCFVYYCDRCDAPLCERVQIMNLALNYVETLLCLACLAQDHEMSEPELAAFVNDYVHSRECFETPWMAFNARACPRLETQTCHCQDDVTTPRAVSA